MTDFVIIISQIFIISFFLNFVYEVSHSFLFETCIEMSLKKYIPRIYLASFADAFFITFYYLISVVIFGELNPFVNKLQIIFFVLACMSFAFLWERRSQKTGWIKYSKQMPMFFGVSVTALLEQAVTGTLVLAIIFLF